MHSEQQATISGRAVAQDATLNTESLPLPEFRPKEGSSSRFPKTPSSPLTPSAALRTIPTTSTDLMDSGLKFANELVGGDNPENGGIDGIATPTFSLAMGNSIRNGGMPKTIDQLLGLHSQEIKIINDPLPIESPEEYLQ